MRTHRRQNRTFHYEEISEPSRVHLYEQEIRANMLVDIYEKMQSHNIQIPRY